MRQAFFAGTAISAIIMSTASVSAAQFNMGGGMRMGSMPMARMAPAFRPAPMMQVTAPMARVQTQIIPRTGGSRIVTPKIAGKQTGVADAARRANEVRRIGSISVAKPDVQAGLDNDPLKRNGRAKGTRDASRDIGMLRQRFGLGGPDGLGNDPAGRLGNTNRNPWGVPGLVPGLNSVPGVSASQGGTLPGDTPNPVAHKEVVSNPDGDSGVALVYTDGTVVTTTRWKDDAGRHTATTVIAPGEGLDTVETIVRPDGSSEVVWDSPGRIDFFRSGRPVNPTRSLTGEETAGNPWWCPPSGWGCKGPLTAADVTSGGRRERPSPDGESSTAHGPSIAGDPQGLAINPNPDVYAAGAAPVSSARSFDGGKLVNPGPCAVPGGC